MAFIMTIIFITTTLFPSNTAYAYDCDVFSSLNSRAFNVKYINVNSQWSQGFDTDRERWNSSQARTNIQYYNSSLSTMTASSYNGTWLGAYTYRYAGTIKLFQIRLYSSALIQQSGTHFWPWVLSTGTHELGHALRLKDNPNPSDWNSSLMNHQRFRETVGAPTTLDINYVRSCY